MKIKPMNKTFAKINFWIIPSVYLIAAFFYIVYIIQPALHFHHQQPSFIFNSVFFSEYLKNPGGVAELIACFFMQFFYFKIAGPLVFLALLSIIPLLTYQVLRTLSNNPFNVIASVILGILSLTLTNSYNFPFSVIISVIMVLAVLLIMVKAGKNPALYLLIYLAAAVIIYFCCGSGYLLMLVVSSVILIPKCKIWIRLSGSFLIASVALLIANFATKYIFAIPNAHKFFFFFPSKPYFIEYHPTVFFDIFILSLPVLLLVFRIWAEFRHKSNLAQKGNRLLIKTSVGLMIVGTVFFIIHNETFQSDAKKLVVADYYCYNDDAENTAKAATTLKEYNFAANLNYNLVMSKTGRLTDDFFGFIQIMGTDALHPDVDFQSDMSFIATDFYYNLGFITEARHWAYETLVFYPYSQRALQSLVKIHLIMREYKAAERSLKILDNGVTGRKFVREFSPFLFDTASISSHPEIAEKRSFMNPEGELSPLVETRFHQLLEANPKNKTAFEFLMLFYLLDEQIENFLNLYAGVEKYFDQPVAVYEEAILLYCAANNIQVEQQFKVSGESLKRFHDFTDKLKQFGNNEKLARNSLYREFGKTYLYWLQFVYPRIVKPEIIQDKYELPPI
jgi:hypothetical protein